ncbi:YeaC family protein [Psychromonas sp. SR45-3]|uniref:YeaC family protein n=1 Tax=Psychromonas sp. SR45-3 TaxID=2760930 RepID=UPI0015F9239B|nr:DUF1315 family protein [Psychromonas sp. SR45-3]MBB1273018.1 DUF1315 family protein [Psychromonas sp. SR45-3]
MSNINEYAKNISSELYEKLKTAVETGKWLDGAPLTEEQKAHSLQLVMAYQKEFNVEPDHFTIAQNGEIYMESKKVLKNQFAKATETDEVHLINL